MSNATTRAVTSPLDKTTFYPNEELTYRVIKDVGLVPNLRPTNLASLEIEKNWMPAMATSRMALMCMNGLHLNSPKRPGRACRRTKTRNY